MCSNCDNRGANRRDLLKFGAAGLVALGLGRATAAGARRRRGGDRAVPRRGVHRTEVRERALCEPSRTLLDRPRGTAERSRRASGALGDDHRLRRQPRASGADIRRSRLGRTLHRAERRQSRRYRDPRDRRIWRRRARLAADRRPRPHELRRGEGGLRRRHQERHISRRDRPDDRPHSAGGDRGAKSTWRFRHQHREGKRQTHRRAADLRRVRCLPASPAPES